jgi:2-keto-3-deoxy-L-rhamnonate aldolase RhmA
VLHQLVQTIQVHIKQLVAVHLQQVVVPVVDQIVAAVAVVQAVHSVRIKVRAVSANRRAEKHCVMNSTICRHHNLVAQLFLTVMARRKYVCVADHHLLTSQKKLVQIQQH